MRTRPVAALALLLAVSGAAQMVDPAIDRPHEPFSYYSRPTDVIGVMDAPEGTEVTPEGYLYTGFGELMFFTGNPPVPVEQRVKTLLQGHLPIVQYSFQRDGLEYHFTMFAATLDGRPEGTLVDFVRVTVRNPGKTQRTGWFTSALRYTAPSNQPNGQGDNRFRRPATPKYPGAYSQPGVNFSPDWTYGFSRNEFMRDGKVMYVFPPVPTPDFANAARNGGGGLIPAWSHLTLKSDDEPPAGPMKMVVQPDEPVGDVTYMLTLAAGKERSLDFKLPVIPLEAGSADAKAVAAANFDRYLASTTDWWEKQLSRGMEITVPETKVNDTLKANLAYLMIARDKVGDDYIQTVTKLHYHGFYLRDGSYMVRALDIAGYPDMARQDLDFFARWQQPDGNFVSQGGQFDGWGQTLWAYGEHYRITHDREFAEKVFPSVVKAVEWLKQARAADPPHLIPVTKPGDNEDIEGHVTGHNFWALAGLKNAIALADALGRKDDAADFQREYDDFRATLIAVLQKVTASTGGYIPPGLDGEHGQDWGNMLSVYPEIILEPHDPMVTATLKATRAKYQEGIMTYGDGEWLHHYLTIKNTDTEVIRGDQDWALGEFYAELMHTSSTHGGFETSLPPWSTRDFGQNLAPHGWFAAKFLTLARNMLVREQGADLHLMSVVSPAWLQAGDAVSVHRAPTDFGEVNYDLRSSATGAVLAMTNKFVTPPARILIHPPVSVETTRVTADGRVVKVENGAVVVPPSTREVRFVWHKKPGAAAYSYAKAVSDWKAEYRRRYEEFLRSGAK